MQPGRPRREPCSETSSRWLGKHKFRSNGVLCINLWKQKKGYESEVGSVKGVCQRCLIVLCQELRDAQSGVAASIAMMVYTGCGDLL